uniref:Uncharacterized protein n=1 Tax=viral metagenome TaxID=1070528 RepID=A0A6M3IJE9_9ZZZZ
MSRKLLFLILAILLLVSFNAYADFNDEATLGGQDSSGQYRWRVNSTAMLPGANVTYTIGNPTHRPSTVYANDVTTDTITSTGNLTFKSTLQATGIGTSGVTTLPTTSASTIDPKTFSLMYVTVCDRTITISNGYAGQILTLVAEELSDTGTTTITATTKTSWVSAAMDSIGDTLTLLYINDTYGWIVIGANSVTVTA